MTLPFRTDPVSPSSPPRPPQDITLRVERLIAAALALNNVTEQGGENHGQMVELMLREAGEPWCAAYVYHVGFWSQYDPTLGSSSWPLPKTGACSLLGHFALVHDILQCVPARGDVFLMYFPSLGRFAHTGIILSTIETASAYLCTTIEGNTNDDGTREGWKTCIKTRLFKKTDAHRFVHWGAL